MPMINAFARAAAVAALLAFATAAPAAARTLYVHDEGKLHYTHSSGEAVIDEGAVRGTLPGSGRVRFSYNGNPTVGASFTIAGHGWSISGHGTAHLHNPNSNTPSFRGQVQITHGTGRYAHANGSGELFGVFNRRTYSLTVQAIGTLRF